MKLFKAAAERVLWRHKAQMWRKVRTILVPLYLRMSDETHSVAKVSAGAGGSRRGRGGARSRRQAPRLRRLAGLPGSPHGRGGALVVG